MKRTTKDFIKEANQIHNNKYDYSQTQYVNNHTKVSIICSTYGAFLQIPKEHLKGSGCLKCNGHFRRTTIIMVNLLYPIQDIEQTVIVSKLILYMNFMAIIGMAIQLNSDLTNIIKQPSVALTNYIKKH